MLTNDILYIGQLYICDLINQRIQIMLRIDLIETRLKRQYTFTHTNQPFDKELNRKKKESSRGWSWSGEHWDEEEIESETQLTEKKERRKSGEI